MKLATIVDQRGFWKTHPRMLISSHTSQMMLVILKRLSCSLSSKWFGIITSQNCLAWLCPKYQASASKRKITWQHLLSVLSACSEAQLIYSVGKKEPQDSQLTTFLLFELCIVSPDSDDLILWNTRNRDTSLFTNVLCYILILHKFGWKQDITNMQKRMLTQGLGQYRVKPRVILDPELLTTYEQFETWS